MNLASDDGRQGLADSVFHDRDAGAAKTTALSENAKTYDPANTGSRFS